MISRWANEDVVEMRALGRISYGSLLAGSVERGYKGREYIGDIESVPKGNAVLIMTVHRKHDGMYHTVPSIQSLYL